MSILARITSKGQTTIPKEVRAALAVGSGDSLVWDIRPDGRVEVRRALPMDLEFHRALEGTLGEWACKEDEEAYRGL